MKLKEINECDLDKCFDLFATFEKDENGFINDAYGLDKEQFKDFVDIRHGYSLGQNLPIGYVPCTKYILVDDDENYIGIFGLRHYLNSFLEKGPGHIGYGISKKYRGHGYAAVGLKLCLEKAKEKGIETAYLSCYRTNAASLKTQLKCGAYIDHEDDKHYYTRIKL